MAAELLRCSDGHLFTANPVKLVFLSVHLIGRSWLRCPIDHKWRIAKPVTAYESDALPEAELREAMRNRF